MSLFPSSPILLVDDEPGVLETYELTLLSQGLDHVVKLSDSRQVAPWLAEHEPSAMVLDLSMPHVSGAEVLQQMQTTAPDVAVIVCTADDDLQSAVRCMRMGAEDYLVKPVESSRFITAVRNAVERWELRQENERLRSSLLNGHIEHLEAFQEIVTGHPRMQAVFRYAEAIAPTARPILIAGETGVGKELLARAIHTASGRSGNFVGVNIAGFDDALLSDTLFGHVRGAFTGADRDRPGLVERAGGGTLFLDEIGDLQPASQVKLLRLLQEQEYLPVGADRPRRSETRFVLATHEDLGHLVEEGRFRKDLYYRVSAHHVEIPPLRERLEDLPSLVEHFVAQASAETGKPPPEVPSDLYELLSRHDFPGNVRELQGIVFDAVATHRRGPLSLEPFRKHLGLPGGGAGPQAVGVPQSGGEAPLRTLAEMEAELIEQALEYTRGNHTRTAKLLGISRAALIRRLKKMSESAQPRQARRKAGSGQSAVRRVNR